jgi:hypothetical protein
MDDVNSVGVDLAKQVFHVHGAAAEGRVLFRKKLSRQQFAKFMASLTPCVVAMACGTAHCWGRELSRCGHEIRLIPPIYVKPFVKRQKNDAGSGRSVRWRSPHLRRRCASSEGGAMSPRGSASFPGRIQAAASRSSAAPRRWANATFAACGSSARCRSCVGGPRGRASRIVAQPYARRHRIGQQDGTHGLGHAHAPRRLQRSSLHGLPIASAGASAV